MPNGQEHVNSKDNRSQKDMTNDSWLTAMVGHGEELANILKVD